MPPRIAVETGVEIPSERGRSYSQTLDDAIKISIIPRVLWKNPQKWAFRQTPQKILITVTTKNVNPEKTQLFNTI